MHAIRRSTGVVSRFASSVLRLSSLQAVPRLAPQSFLQETHRRQFCTANAKLATFLQEEIEAEKDEAAKQLGAAAPSIPGFTAQTNEADVTLSKKYNNENITVRFNVNHTVDVEPMQPMMEEEQAQQEEAPRFFVEVEKQNGTKLGFTCIMADPDTMGEPQAEGEGGELDTFNIDEVYLYSGTLPADGQLPEHVYVVGGQILGETLYDHLMEYLDVRGINNTFATAIVEYSTHYEHGQYVNLLQKIKDFVAV